MKPSNAPLNISICSLLLTAGSVHGAAIAWTTSPGLQDTEVRTLGTQVFGYYWSASGGADPVVVNTVPFVLQTTTTAPPELNFNGSYNNVEGIDLYQAPLTADNAGLSQILDGQNWGNPAAALTMIGLTSGQQYLVQFMISEDRAAYVNTRNYDVSDGNDPEGARDIERAYHSTRGGGVPPAAPVGSVEAKIFTGTFVADATGTQEIWNWLYEGTDHNGGNSGSQVNAIQLRSIPLSTSKTWSGTVNGTWDTSTANFTGFAFATGDNVTFGDVDGGGSVAPVTRNITIQPGGVTPGLAMTVNNSTGDYTFTGSINGAANQTMLTKEGTGALTLAGATDNPGLSATVNAGTLLLGKTSSATVHAVAALTVGPNGTARLTGTGGDQIADTGLLAVSGVFDLNGSSEAVNGLAGASTGSITNRGSAPATLTVGAGNGAGIFSGVISDGTTAATALVKVGTGAQSLTGANTFTGGTTVNGGTLSLGFGGNVGTLPPGSVVTVNANGTLRFTATDALGFNAGSTAPVTVNGGVVTADAGIHQTLQGVILNGGTLTAIGPGDAGLNSSNYIIDNTITTQAAANVATINAPGIILRGNPTGGPTDAPVTFNVARGTAPVDLAVSSMIEDSGRGLIKEGPGIARFNVPSLYTGPTVINAGTLSVASNAALGTGPVSLSGGTLQLAGGTAAIGINFVGGGGPSPGGASVTGVAGVVPIANWNNIFGNVGGPNPLNDANGVVGTASLDTFISTNTWATGSVNPLLNGYLDNTDANPNAQSVTVSGIPFGSYSVYAYFGSDGAGRTGSVSLNGATFFYSTRGNVADYVLTTDDVGAVNPLANYAVFNDVTGSGFTINQSRGTNNSGLIALEIVQSQPVPVALANGLNVTTNSTIDVTGANAGSITGQVTIGSTQLSVTGGSNGANADYSLSLGTTGGVSLSGSPTFNVAKNGTGAGNVTVGAITQTAAASGITKTGDGTLIATGASTYTGPTVINGGALIVAGSLSGTSAISVNSGGTLGGAGTITTPGAVTAATGARLAPGAQLLSPGTLSISATTLNLSAEITGNSQSLLFNLGSVSASSKVALTAGNLNIGDGKLAFGDFQFVAGNGFGAGTYTLFDTSSAIAGTLNAAPGNLTGSINLLPATLSLGDGGRDILLTVIPEPNSLTALLGGLGMLGSLRSFRRRKSRQGG
jgi:autotransporter-associated beta strand protein